MEAVFDCQRAGLNRTAWAKRAGSEQGKAHEKPRLTLDSNSLHDPYRR